MSTPHIVVAIDGPAASGKSSVARTLARRLKLVYVNTGAMYRAVTWWLLHKGVEPGNTARVISQLNRLKIECGLLGSDSTITLDGEDPSPHLSESKVNHSVSTISGIYEVRHELVKRQRAYAEHYDLVMEGRDIGSAVFPETPFKFYIDASPDVRAHRRKLQGFQDEIGARDRYDSSRKASPLVIAEDAHVIDSSHLTIDGVVGEIVGRLKLKGMNIEEL